MVEILGTGIEAEETEVLEEGRSILGSLINRLIAIIHRIVHEVLLIARRLIAYASEHPLATVLLTANICIWIS